jgi:CheY-like chemotaxis protein
MIARLRDLEWMLRTDSGQTIVNLFPDLPPIKSSWLLRRVPYRSRIGGLALGEERFLLGRVGASEESFNYFLLPKRIAESAQGDRNGLSRSVFFEWLVPQWFFQRYEEVPNEKQILWILLDEYGNARWSESSITPWSDTREIEEEPHPAISQGAELQELERGWRVLTLTLDPNAPPRGRIPARPPLTGRRILWVDDHPDYNMFEVSYLEQLGASVSRAVSTELALSHLASNDTDLIISDLSRTENGVQRELAGHELWKQVRGKLPIIFYTWDRDQVPEEIRALTTHVSRELFRLVEEHLRS